ncbi:MAG: signal peptidase I [Verrucomicrobiales bacterium]|nr:signal peptidase I [Verrucomicrobiales bacterium]
MHSRKMLLLAGVLVGTLLLFRCRYSFILTVGDSMRPTISNGTMLLLDRSAYRCHPPQRGDIVVADYFGERITKRVVGLPEEKVAVEEGRVMINGAPLEEDHAVTAGTLTIEPGRLQSGRYALLGDNRNYATGETIHAVVTRDQILGRVVGSCGGQPGR